MGRSTLSNARYRARPSARQSPPRYRGKLLIQRARAWIAQSERELAAARMSNLQWNPEELDAIRLAATCRAEIEQVTGVQMCDLQRTRAIARVRHAELRPHLDRLIKFMEDHQPGRIALSAGAQHAMNQSRTAMLQNIATGRVHIGRWTLRWYALRRFFQRIWSRRDVD